ncbi:hypothetical protein JK163_12025 [Levilactobacillus brevis]|uniref:hypothetical protein n=1 Tax=Levilactobacillus brevis TaxID=1580 RepID=UPI001BA68CB5|nr:hypothetical protein [Levilactobacillus brevis]MBS1006990.1 hypothetical protein [Levilactobacillus brevis]
MIYKIFYQQLRYFSLIPKKLSIISGLLLLSIWTRAVSLLERNLNFMESYWQVFNFFQIGFLYLPIVIVAGMTSINGNIHECLRVGGRRVMVLQNFCRMMLIQTLFWLIWVLGVWLVFGLSKSIDQSDAPVLMSGLVDVYLAQITLMSIGILGYILTRYMQVAGMVMALMVELITMGMAYGKHAFFLRHFLLPEFSAQGITVSWYPLVIIIIVYVFCQLAIISVDF